MSTIVLNNARNRRTGEVKADKLARALQIAEARHDATRQASTAAIIVPQVDGTMVPLAKYQIDRMTPPLVANAWDQYNAFYRKLCNEATEIVENKDDEPFEMSLNGVWYSIGPRETKALPQTLARHARQKLSYRNGMKAYDTSLNAADQGQAIREMDFGKFQHAVQSYDQVQANHFDSAPRKFLF